MRLPKIELPTFSDSYTEWTAYWDLFNASVDSNAQLSDAQKLQYLKSSLKGETSKLVAPLTPNNANYALARTTLANRYHNTRVITRAHISSFMSFQSLKQESGPQLRRLIDTFYEHTEALKNHGVEICDAMLVYLLTEKCDPETRKMWEMQSTGTDVQKFKDLHQFLEQRCAALESSPVTQKQDPRRTTSSHHSTPTTQKNDPRSSNCANCSGNHLSLIHI